MLRRNLPDGVRVFIGDEPASDKGRWMVAFLGGMVAPQIQEGHPVFYSSLGPLDPDLARYYHFEPALQLPAPFPGPTAPGSSTIYKITDPADFSSQARRTFQREFPDAINGMVQGREMQTE